MTEPSRPRMLVAEFAERYRSLTDIVGLDMSSHPDTILIVDGEGERTYVAEAPLGPPISTCVMLSPIQLKPLRGRSIKVRILDEVDHYAEIPVVGSTDGDAIHWHAGDVRGLISGPYARTGWASRCLDPATNLWETHRLSRRAARRQRGRARAAARAARRSIDCGRRIADRLEAVLADA